MTGALCGCGHPRACHYSWNTGEMGHKCQATIYTQVHMGMSATTCPCPRFQARKRDKQEGQ